VRFDEPGDSRDQGRSIAVSPDGSTVVVTGSSGPDRWSFDIVSVAYDAETGAHLWARRFAGPDGASDRVRDLAISADGGSVYVTGYQDGPTAAQADYEVIGYSIDGVQLWSALYDGGSQTTDRACCLASMPDDSGIVVTGTGFGGYPTYFDMLTLRLATA
jgi:WD40 repeat protein